MKLFTLTEWLVLAIVLLSTFTLINEPIIEEEEKKEVSNITGTIILSTRSAMDSLGLEDFKQGAIATINLDSNNILSTNCGICTNDPIGIQLNGSGNLTNLEGLSSGGIVIFIHQLTTNLVSSQNVKLVTALRLS